MFAISISLYMVACEPAHQETTETSDEQMGGSLEAGQQGGEENAGSIQGGEQSAGEQTAGEQTAGEQIAGEQTAGERAGMEAVAGDEPEDCQSATLYFEELAWPSVFNQTCIACHNGNGAASHTRLVLDQDESPEGLARSFMSVQAVQSYSSNRRAYTQMVTAVGHFTKETVMR